MQSGIKPLLPGIGTGWDAYPRRTREGDQTLQEGASRRPAAILSQGVRAETAGGVWDRVRNLQDWWRLQEGNEEPVLPDDAPSQRLEATLHRCYTGYEPTEDDIVSDEEASGVAGEIRPEQGIMHMLYDIGHDILFCPCPECDLDRAQEARAQ